MSDLITSLGDEMHRDRERRLTESQPETIAARYNLSCAPVVRDGMVIRVRAWRYDGIDDLMALDPDADAPDSVWTYDPTA